MRIRDLPIQELLKRCKDEDAAAWNEIVQRHRKVVYSVPLRLGLAEEHATEVFQNVFESLWRNLDHVQHTSGITSWLYTAARRLSLRRLVALRREAQTRAGDDDLLGRLPSDEVPMSQRVEDAERQAQVLRQVEALSEPCRSLIEVLFLDPNEPDYDSVAERLGIARGSIGPTRARCLKKLYDLMEKQDYPFRHA